MANKLIDDLSAAVSLAATDKIELSGGKYCTLEQLAEFLIEQGVTAIGDVLFGPLGAELDILEIEQLENGLNAGGVEKTEWSFPKVTEIAGDCNIETTTVTSVQFAKLEEVSGRVSLQNASNLTVFTAPLLASCQNFLMDEVGLTSLVLPSLATINGNFTGTGAVTTTITLASLTTITGNVNFAVSLLETFSAPAWLPTDGSTIIFSECALNVASVNHILARCVAAGLTTATIDLSGGTSAAPTGQGAADVITLTNAGCSVTTN